jgi:hypothetical protein
MLGGKSRLLLRWSSLVSLVPKTSLSTPGVRSAVPSPGLADRVRDVLISFIKAENIRFGSTGVDDSSNRLSIGIGSRKAARFAKGNDLRFIVIDAT